MLLLIVSIVVPIFGYPRKGTTMETIGRLPKVLQQQDHPLFFFFDFFANCGSVGFRVECGNLESRVCCRVW